MSDSNPAWHNVASADALQPHGKTLVWLHKRQIAVFQQGDRVFALDDTCPHSGASLCVGRVEDGHVRCPAHGLRFRLGDGLLAGSPAGSAGSSLGVRTYPARVVDGMLQIQLEPEFPAPAA